jgi:hypothetical protein
MAEKKSGSETGQRLQRADQEALGAAQAERAGVEYQWHFGRVTSLGAYEFAGGRGVTIAWEGGGVTSQQGTLSEEQWEIFKLAFLTTGRIAVLSDQDGEEWMYDYRFLEALR